MRETVAPLPYLLSCNSIPEADLYFVAWTFCSFQQCVVILKHFSILAQSMEIYSFWNACAFNISSIFKTILNSLLTEMKTAILFRKLMCQRRKKKFFFPSLFSHLDEEAESSKMNGQKQTVDCWHEILNLRINVRFFKRRI